MPHFAANLSLMFTEMSFLDRFDAARGNGFEAVEFLFPYAYPACAIADRLARARLKLVLHNLPAGQWEAGERGMACDPHRVAEFRDSVALAIAYASALGVNQLHCLSGLLPAGVAPALAHQTLVANLRYAARCLDLHGMRLLIEPINTADMPGYFLTSSAQAAAVIADCGVDNLFMQCDLYHLQRMGEDLAHSLRAWLPLIRHIQVADTPGRHEPGTGTIDFRALFALLDELGYDGWVGCEYHPRAGTVAGLGWRRALLD